MRKDKITVEKICEIFQIPYTKEFHSSCFKVCIEIGENGSQDLLQGVIKKHAIAVSSQKVNENTMSSLQQVQMLSHLNKLFSEHHIVLHFFLPSLPKAKKSPANLNPQRPSHPDTTPQAPSTPSLFSLPRAGTRLRQRAAVVTFCDQLETSEVTPHTSLKIA